MRIIGIDPGTLATGYGIVESVQGNRLVHVCDGVIPAPKSYSLEARLLVMATGLERVIAQYSPQGASVETPFGSKNLKSAILISHARGALLLTAARADLPVFEYAPMTIKKAVTGYGGATKEQVKAMVERLLKTASSGALDATDALATAICHIHSYRPLLQEPSSRASASIRTV